MIPPCSCGYRGPLGQPRTDPQCARCGTITPWEGDLTAEEQALIDAAWERHKAATPSPLTPNDIAVIRERYHGWEQASASTLAAVFGVSVQRISAIVRRK